MVQPEIVLEQTAIDDNGIPQYEKAIDRLSWLPVFGQILAYCVFFFSIALSGA